MRGFQRLALAAAMVAAVTASDVHDLTKDTFKAFIEEHDLVLAECK
jgi:protein disulfide-isomerase A1